MKVVSSQDICEISPKSARHLWKVKYEIAKSFEVRKKK